MHLYRGRVLLVLLKECVTQNCLGKIDLNKYKVYEVKVTQTMSKSLYTTCITQVKLCTAPYIDSLTYHNDLLLANGIN